MDPETCDDCEREFPSTDDMGRCEECAEKHREREAENAFYEQTNRRVWG